MLFFAGMSGNIETMQMLEFLEQAYFPNPSDLPFNVQPPPDPLSDCVT
jgi:hypothetical protein